MHRYRMEFISARLDETALRELLERSFAIKGLSITRERVGPGPQRPVRGLGHAILQLLADQRPWRANQIIDRLAEQGDHRRIGPALIRLEQRGEIEKVRHGVYIAAGAPIPDPKDIPPLEWKGSTPTRDRMWELLRTPKSPPELRDALGLTRQRVEQMLADFVEKGLVRRHAVAGERARHVYVRTDSERRDDLLKRHPLLAPSRARLLSVLPAEVLCRATDVADVAAVPQSTVSGTLEELSAQGLVVTFRLTQRRYVGLTPRGLAHPDWDHDGPKAAPADVVADVGPLRTRFLQVLSVLGEARTREITDGLHAINGGRVHGSGQLIQRLEQAELVEIAEHESDRQATYRLTEKGRFVAALLNRHWSPPSADEMRQSIQARRRARADETRHRGTATHGSPAQDAIMDVVRRFGPVATTAIPPLMAVKFKNPRSINLALRNLQDRGLLRSKPSSQGRKELIWRLSDETDPA